MMAAVRAELLDLETVGVVPTVLLGDVVTVLAHLAGQGDLGPYVGTRRHVSASFNVSSSMVLDETQSLLVAVGGLDPPTSRL